MCNCSLSKIEKNEIVISMGNGEYPPDDIERVVHCVCLCCNAEWVE